jgi:hypothetical protein
LKNFAKKNRKKRAGVDHTSNQAVPGPTNGGHFKGTGNTIAAPQ